MIHARFKQVFEDFWKMTSFEQGRPDNIAAGFKNSCAQHGGKPNSLVSIAPFAAQHGLICVGLDIMPGYSSIGSTDVLNRYGSCLGVMTQSNNDQCADVTPIRSDLDTASYVCKRIVLTTDRFTPV
ncbi:hypothetical protein NRB_09780 [Novosphingobium sp. 11B]